MLSPEIVAKYIKQRCGNCSECINPNGKWKCDLSGKKTNVMQSGCQYWKEVRRYATDA